MSVPNASLRSRLALAAVLLTAPAAASAQAPELLKDVNPVADESWSANPRALTAGTSRVYFAAGNLWRTDGTPAGTRVVRDLGVSSLGMATIGDLVVFARDEPWVSDGTPAGTRLLKDIGPTYESAPASGFVSAGPLVFFTADEGAGPWLWRTDGTPEGTIRVTTAAASPGVGGDGTLHFGAHSAAAGYELWRSDGTPGGTAIVADLCPGPCTSSPGQLVRAGAHVYFTADDGTHGRQLWRTHATTGGVERVTDLANVQFLSIAALGDGVLFSTAVGPTLWQTDGTPGGTHAIAAVRALHLTAAGAQAYFVGEDALTGRELWRTDGTGAGTTPIDACPGACSTFPPPDAGYEFSLWLRAAPDRVYFTVPGALAELWTSEGTVAGTVRLVAGALYEPPVVLGGSLYFSQYDPAFGRELWTSDGTPAGTVPLTAAVRNDARIETAVAAGDRLFFRAFRPDVGSELWVTEGTDATTAPLDLERGPDESVTRFESPLGRDLVFQRIGTPGAGDTGYWKTDGTIAGTAVLAGATAYGQAKEFGGAALFPGSADSTASGIVRTDGTPGGTALLADLGSAQGGMLGAWGGLQYFGAFDGSPELWATDGTTAGSRALAPMQALATAPFGAEVLAFTAFDEMWRSDGWPQGTVTTPWSPEQTRHPVAAGGQVFFTAESGAFGLDRELWRTDGSGPGTFRVKDIAPGPASGIESHETAPIVVLNGVAYFAAWNETHGRELWRSDGTSVGTVLVKDIMPGPEWGIHRPFEEPTLTVAGGRLWFAAYAAETGFELWQSDGTAAGTQPVADIAPGPASSVPERMRVAGGRLYFTADDGVHGREWWTLQLPPSLEALDLTTDEGDAAATAEVTVALSRAPATQVTVSYQTTAGSALPGLDYVSQSGTLTFAPGGPLAQTVAVPLVGDLQDERQETFLLRLSAPVGGTLARGEATVLIRDDDAPRVLAHDAAAAEGDAGSAPSGLRLELRTKDGGPNRFAQAVAFGTAPSSAIAGVDFVAAAGTVTFPAGAPDGALTEPPVSVLGDTLDEADERFTVRYAPASDVVADDREAAAVIVDDDGGAGGTPVELLPGTVLRRALGAPAGAHAYLLRQEDGASYEIVVDETSGDVQPLRVERLLPGGTTVVQAATASGTGGSVRMAWKRNTWSGAAVEEIRIGSGGCGAGCGADDTYRVRVYDTTLRGPRVINSATVGTHLVLYNRSAHPAEVEMQFWNASGAFGSSTLAALAPGETRVVTQSYVGSGSVTVAHTAGYGGLEGKLVTTDTANGFSFDTPLAPRPR